jgi:glycine oxidase
VTGVRTLIGDYAAPVVVNAAGSWAGRIPGCAPAVPVVPQLGQILALGPGEVRLRRVVRTPGDPYLVPRVDGRVVVGATRELVGYDASLTAEGVGWLLSSAVRIAPRLARSPIAELWTGFRPLSQDGLPFIGPGEVDGLYFATGHGPHGISPAPGTARLLAALIAGEPLPVPPEPFDPRRVRRSAGDG